jgi:hypothetical protein
VGEQGALARTPDFASGQLDEAAINGAERIAFYVPMPTATRLTTNVVRPAETDRQRVDEVEA